MKPTELAAKADISVPYASQLLNGTRKPSHRTALILWRKTGMQFGALEGLSKRTVKALDEADRKTGEESCPGPKSQSQP